MRTSPPRFRTFIFTSVTVACLLFAQATPSARANIPGGGTGAGANVTLVNNGDGTITMANGIVTAVIKIATAQILKLTYKGIQVTDGGTASNSAFYWQGTAGSSDTLVTVANPSANGGNYAEIDLEDPATSSGNGADAHRHFTMFRGSPGIYVTEIMTRSSTAAAAGVDTVSFTCKLSSSPMNWLAQNANSSRNLAMPNVSDLASAVGGVNFAPKEATLLTTGNFPGQFDCKYDYAGDLGALSYTGWCSTTSDIGLWMIHPSNEYFTSGPMHREILTQLMLLNATFKGVHFTFNDDENFSAGETWAKVCGPFFLYFNSVTAGTGNPQVPLVADVNAQAQVERGAWPYTWFTDANYAQASGRGTVTGKIVISDPGNPFASAANLWVGLAQQPPSATVPQPADFQQFGKRYQYWTKSDSGGNFTIPNIVSGTGYTLYAFGPGAIGQFQSQPLSGATVPVSTNIPATPFSVTITGGSSTALGTVTWTPTRVGSTVWEIGIPDRDTQEFRHGDDYWHGELGTASVPAECWAPFQYFNREWPQGLKYTAGQSHWSIDWDYAQPTVLDPSNGNLNYNPWTISFVLPRAPLSGSNASLYMGIASDSSGPITITINSTALSANTTGVTATPAGLSTNPAAGFFPWYDNDAMIRMSSHGVFCDERVTFPGSLLKAGTNTITLAMRKGGYFGNAAAYDYVRLELAGYIPPAPANLNGLAGNANVILRWPAAPGAVSYNLVRSTTSGSGYIPVTSGVTGPVSGSTPDTASYIDSTATNGIPYFYVIQSVNSSGTSANSIQTTVTPLSTVPATPAVPTALSATAGDMQVSLNWNAPANAAYYLVGHSTTSGGPYSTISDSGTTSSYIDLGRSNRTPYYYVVAAVNASGTSPYSTEVSCVPLPAPVIGAPSNLAASNLQGAVNLTWSTVAGASTYVIRRATSANGTYTVVNNHLSYANLSDSTAAANTAYFYEVAGGNLAGTGSFSAPVSLTTAPAAPATLTATPGNTQVQLTWTPSAGANGYLLQRGTATGVYTKNITTIGPSYVDTALTNGTTYYYTVSATSTANGTGDNSTEASATPLATLPLAPTNLSATPGNTQVTLSWNASAGASTYTVRRSGTDGGPYSNLTTTLTGTTYSNTALTNGATYYYVVAAANASGGGANSNQVSAIPLPPIPAAPTGLTGTAGNAQVSLGWTAPSGATGYLVRRGSASGSYNSTVSVSSTSFTDSGLTNGQTYYYAVAASNLGGVSPNSSEIVETPAQTFSQWIAAAFPGVSATNVIGLTANPDNDAYNNLIEYFIGTRAALPDPPNAITSTTDGAGNLVLNFRMSKNLSDIAYTVEESSDLVYWTSAGVTPVIVSDQGAYYQMKASVPLPANSQPLFLRISVTGGP